MAVICTSRYSPKQFNGHGPGEYTVEASDLARGDFWSRVWDDAADVGFIIHSDRHNKDFIFILDHVERDADQDVRWWDFVSCKPNGQPTDVPMKVTVWND